MFVSSVLCSASVRLLQILSGQATEHLANPWLLLTEKSDGLILLIDFSSCEKDQRQCVGTDWERGRGEVVPGVIYKAVHH